MDSGAGPDAAGAATLQPDSSSPIAPDLGSNASVDSITGLETGTGTGGASGMDAFSATGGAGGTDASLGTGGTTSAGVAGGASSTGSAQGGNGTGGAGQAGAGGTGPVDYSGFWAGLTNQQKLASFRVFANAVTVLTIDWILPKVSNTCSPAGDTTTTFGTPAPITSAATFTKGPVSGGAVSYTLAGQFSSDTAATGTVNISYSANGCNSSSIISWSAQKVVCGDGVMQWPETCDPGNPLATAGCSTQCQLLPVAETEPNNSIATANGPYVQDTLISAAISQPDDVDYFAVRNPIAGSIAIEFETHGETVGTCGVDTFMQVFKSTGEVIASDDDGARAFYCSYAMVSVAAGETVYVAVSSSIAQPISRYLLHIRFPHS
jgi:cysteine-rich repeat protein